MLARSPSRGKSVRLRVFRGIGPFLREHARQFPRLLMGMFAYPKVLAGFARWGSREMVESGKMDPLAKELGRSARDNAL